MARVGERQVGFFDAVSGSVEAFVDFPFGGGGATSFTQWWNNNRCASMNVVESGLRVAGSDALANAYAKARRFSGCYNEPPPPLNKQTPENGYEGGQCPGSTYRVEISWVNSGRGPGNGAVTPRGPVTFIGLGPSPANPTRTAILVVGRNLLGEEQTFQLHAAIPPEEITSWSLDLFEVTSGPDDCGNAPGQGPQYPPGQELAPPGNVGDEIGEAQDITITEDTPDGPVEVTYEFGPIINLGTDGIGTTINGEPIRIAPDGHIGADDPDPLDGQPDGRDEEQEQEQTDKLMSDVIGAITVFPCNQDSLEGSYSGQGIDGLKNLIETATGLLSIQIESLCSSGNDVAPIGDGILLSSGTFSQGEVRNIPLPSTAVEVQLEVTGFDTRIRVFKLAGNEIEADFGWWSIAFEDGNDRFAQESTRVRSPRVSLDAPPPRGRQRFVRLSLKSEVQYNLYYSEEQ